MSHRPGPLSLRLITGQRRRERLEGRFVVLGPRLAVSEGEILVSHLVDQLPSLATSSGQVLLSEASIQHVHQTRPKKSGPCLVVVCIISFLDTGKRCSPGAELVAVDAEAASHS